MRVHRVKIVLSTVVLAALAAAPLAAQDWAGRGRAQGQVKDEEGNPVEGAKITLHQPDKPEAGPEPVVTNENGRWAVGGLGGGPWKVVIEKEGFATSEGSFNVNEFAPSQPLVVELQRNPFDAVTAGQELIDEGRYAEARAQFEKVLPEMDEHQQAQLHALIGTTYYEEKNFAAARDAYEKSLPGLTPEEQTSVRLRLGDSYLQQGEFEAARAAYEQVLDQIPGEGRAQVLLAIARSYDQQGQRDEAIETVERILEQDPGDVQALQLIADLLSRAGREEEAQAFLDRIPEDEALPADMLLNQGIRFYNDEDYDQALSNFDRVIRQDPTQADAFYYRGLSYLAQGKNAEAAADLAKYVELAPDGQYADQAREFLEFLQPSR
jgi:tetratricopeptide (TPR) repeat protein